MPCYSGVKPMLRIACLMASLSTGVVSSQLASCFSRFTVMLRTSGKLPRAVTTAFWQAPQCIPLIVIVCIVASMRYNRLFHLAASNVAGGDTFCKCSAKCCNKGLYFLCWQRVFKGTFYGRAGLHQFFCAKAPG